MKSRIEWGEINHGHAIYCAECGEYLLTVTNPPHHDVYVCIGSGCDVEN